VCRLIEELQLSAGIEPGFWQVTIRQTTAVVPPICVLHCP